MEDVIPTEVAVPFQCLAIILPLLGNVSMIVIVCRVPMLHTPSFVLLSCLAAVDIILALVWNFPFNLMDKTMALDTTGSGACTVLGIVWQTAVSMSALLQATVAFDRYLFIVHPFKYQRYITSARAACSCVATFALSISLPAFIFVSGEPYRMEKPMMTCIQSKLWPLLFLTITFLPSVALAAFCSQRVWALYSRMLQQIELMQDCTVTPVPSLGSHLDLQSRQHRTLRKVIQSVILRNRVLKLKKVEVRRQKPSKPDQNTAAPTVMVTSCEKNEDISIFSRKSSKHHAQGEFHDDNTVHSLAPVETPILTTPMPGPCGTRTIDSALSPRSSCSSPGSISLLNCPTEKSPNFLSPYPYHQQSHRQSVLSNDSSRSHLFLFSPESSGSPGFDFSSSESGYIPSSPSPSSCSVSLYGRQSSQSSFTEAEDVLTDGPSTVSAILSALIVKPDSFLFPSPHKPGKRSPLPTGQSKKERKLARAALHWASVGNPVISWMLSLQPDQTDEFGCKNSREDKNRRVSSISYPVSSQEPTNNNSEKSDRNRTCGEFWVKIKCKLAAKWGAAKALLLLWGPLYFSVVSFLPYSIALIVWEFGLRSPLVSHYVYVVCFLTYTIVPSLAALVLCLTNKPYRKVLFKYICCHRKSRDD